MNEFMAFIKHHSPGTYGITYDFVTGEYVFVCRRDASEYRIAWESPV